MSNNCKYYKQQKQFSTNSGETWSNVTPYEYRRGSLIESDSPDCQEEVMITRFVTIPDAFLCDGKNKYEKQVAQYSLDNGATWQYYYPSIYQNGNLIESNADICDNKWEGYYTGDTTNICSNGYTYVAGRGCVKNSSSGGGGTTCKPNSRYYFDRCIYVDPVKYVRCSSTTSTTLTRDDVNYPPYKVYAGYIGDCVTNIDDRAFQNCSGLTSVDIPSSVTSIGEATFSGCTSLSSLTIPNSVTSIGRQAFNQTPWYASYSADTNNHYGNIIYINDVAYHSINGNITGCTFKENTVSIADEAFAFSNLEIVEIPSGITSIGNGTFRSTNLGSLRIPNNITSIGNEAFRGCNSLRSLAIGSGITSIGESAFRSCYYLIGITIEATTPPTLGSSALYDTNNCPIYVPCVAYESYKTAWSQYSSRIRGFDSCAQYRWYPSGTTCVGADKYQNNIKQISYDYATTWENVNPAEYSASTLIEANSTDCGYVPPTSIKWIAIYGSGNISSGACSSYSGISGVNGQIIRKNISSLVIGDCVTYIEDSGFAGYHSLSSLTIGQNIETIGRQAFAGCSGLTSVIIPNSVITIGGYAFAECINLTAITFGNSVTTIGDQTFRRCSGLTIVVLPNTIETIDAWGFADCGGLTSITMSSGLTTIGEGAFYNDNSLSSIIIPSSVTTIGGRAFMNCSGLTSIIIYATTPPAFGASGVFNNTNNCPIYVPASSVSAYQSAWSDYASRIQPIPST